MHASASVECRCVRACVYIISHVFEYFLKVLIRSFLYKSISSNCFVIPNYVKILRCLFLILSTLTFHVLTVHSRDAESTRLDP